MAIDTLGANALASDSVTSVKIATDAITTAKIANDAVTGAKIPADAVVAADIADGSITTAKLAANAVTVGKMATSGTLPAFDGSSLTSIGTVQHIKTQTGTNASSIDFLHGSNGVVFDGTYDIYEFIMHYVYGSGNNELRIEPSQDGSGFTTTNTVGHTTSSYRASGSSSAWNVDIGTTGFFRGHINSGNAANEISGGQIRIYSPFDSAKNTIALTTISSYQTSGVYAIGSTMGAMTAAGRTYGVRFRIQSNNIYAKISLYGIKDS